MFELVVYCENKLIFISIDCKVLKNQKYDQAFGLAISSENP